MSFVSNVDGLELYKFSEFPVVVGNRESSMALCVVWQSLDRVMANNPDLKEKFALIGNLRSPFGVNIILYNLALNPTIKHLVVWGPDKLSNTNIGLIGKSALLGLWNNGFNEERGIKGTNFRLVKEIDGIVLTKMLDNVRIYERSTSQALDLSDIDARNNGKYMEPVRFKEFIPRAPDLLPSEGFTYLIRDKKGADAYLQLLYHIWRYGRKTPINKDGEDVKELRGTVVVVESEDPSEVYLPDWLVSYKPLAVSKENLDNYYKTQFAPDFYRKEVFEGIYKFERPKDYPYMYTELINAFPRPQGTDEKVFRLLESAGYERAKDFLVFNSYLGKQDTDSMVRDVEQKISGDTERISILLEGLMPVTDQLSNAIERIKQTEPDLDKEIILWDVRYHSKLKGGRPCLEKLSFSVRDGTVDVHAFVRTHDIGMAWFHNFYGITKLLDRVTKQTGKKPGYIIIESQSAHIYQRDWESIGQLIKARIDEAPIKMYFDPERDTDPRGLVSINVAGNMIRLKLLNPKTGETILEMEGNTARQLIYKIKHFGIISRVDHAAFVGSELAKAEMCIKLGVDYKYDTAIELKNGERLVS